LTCQGIPGSYRELDAKRWAEFDGVPYLGLASVKQPLHPR
jgi:hypothetical protein